MSDERCDVPDGVRWDYWCPHAGTHVIDPNELHVGLFSDAGGEGMLLLTAAVIPPMESLDGHRSQAEPIARAVKAAMEQADLSVWVRANRGNGFPWPRALSGSRPDEEGTDHG